MNRISSGSLFDDAMNRERVVAREGGSAAHDSFITNTTLFNQASSVPSYLGKRRKDTCRSAMITVATRPKQGHTCKYLSSL